MEQTIKIISKIHILKNDFENVLKRDFNLNLSLLK